MSQIRRQPTQADIAQKANVSTATVSRVLNNLSSVKSQTRKRVEAAIAQFGYYPHGAARALASNRTFTIGAIIPTLNNAIFAAGINAFERQLQASNYTLLVAVSNYDQSLELTQVRRLLERGVEGLLLVGNDHAGSVHEMLRRTGALYVNTWTHDPICGHPNVGFSNRKAATMVVDHLLALGHRRFGMIAGITAGNDRARDRLVAVQERLAAHGLDLDPLAVQEVRYSIREARRGLVQIIERGRLPTAMICGNDVIGLGVLFEAQERGIDVPGRLSITGFDNLPLTEHIRPGITTIDIPAAQMGRAAAEALLAAVRTKRPVASRELAAQLLVRGTTAPPG